MDNVWSIAFMPDGETLVSGSADSTVRLWGVVGDRSAGTTESLRALNSQSVKLVASPNAGLGQVSGLKGVSGLSGSNAARPRWGVKHWGTLRGDAFSVLSGAEH
ncbi:MAG: hypothetical protein IMY86_12890 [Chloroflexi bacterium]|nr:hypothetical protein [Chloroflexota bacterium]